MFSNEFFICLCSKDIHYFHLHYASMYVSLAPDLEYLSRFEHMFVELALFSGKIGVPNAWVGL